MVEKRPFGKDSFLLRITDGPCACEIIPQGAAIRSLTVPDREGRPLDVVLGYDTPEEYLSRDACLGAVVGRCANRIAGASFLLNGQTYSLTPNDGPNTLHGGPEGYHHRLWDLSPEGEDTVVCALRSPHGDQGFPGSLEVRVRYTLRGSALTVAISALSDADTVVNLTNHAYFNLGGHQSGSVADHIFTLAASRFTPSDPANIPLGTYQEVAGTPFDLRSPTPLSERLDAPELQGTRGFDHNFLWEGSPAASVTCPRTGITLDMTTDLPGFQLYTAGWLTRRPGKEGASYAPGQGFCLESQFFPNAVNTPAFPSPVVLKGQPWRGVTTFAFRAE